MASTPEALVKKKIKKILETHGVYYAMPVGSMYGNAGVPDFCAVSPAATFWQSRPRLAGELPRRFKTSI